MCKQDNFTDVKKHLLNIRKIVGWEGAGGDGEATITLARGQDGKMAPGNTVPERTRRHDGPEAAQTRPEASRRDTAGSRTDTAEATNATGKRTNATGSRTDATEAAQTLASDGPSLRHSV